MGIDVHELLAVIGELEVLRRLHEKQIADLQKPDEQTAPAPASGKE